MTLNSLDDRDNELFSQLKEKMGHYSVQDPASPPVYDDFDVTAPGLNKDFFQKLARESDPLLRKIWGSKCCNNLLTTNVLAHLSLFAVPAFISEAQQLNAKSYGRVFNFRDEVNRVIRVVAQAVGILDGSPKPGILQKKLYVPHLALIEKRRWDPARSENHRGQKGISHLNMGYFVYELLRAAEFMAEQGGIVLSPEELENHFYFFAQIMQRAGYHFPDRREEMEALAQEVDRLLGKLTRFGTEIIARAVILYRAQIDQVFLDELNSSTAKDTRYLIDPADQNMDMRMFRGRLYELRADTALNFEQVGEFLRPAAGLVFGTVADTYALEELWSHNFGEIYRTRETICYASSSYIFTDPVREEMRSRDFEVW